MSCVVLHICLLMRDCGRLCDICCYDSDRTCWLIQQTKIFEPNGMRQMHWIVSERLYVCVNMIYDHNLIRGVCTMLVYDRTWRSRGCEWYTKTKHKRRRNSLIHAHLKICVSFAYRTSSTWWFMDAEFGVAHVLSYRTPISSESRHYAFIRTPRANWLSLWQVLWLTDGPQVPSNDMTTIMICMYLATCSKYVCECVCARVMLLATFWKMIPRPTN